MNQVPRRRFLISTAALFTASLARAQPERMRVVGALYPNPSTVTVNGKLLRAADYYADILKELGWKVGTNVRIEDASAEGDDTRLPALAAALVAKKVDVIWVGGPEAAIAAAKATTIIPIAFYGIGYPVEQGFVKSLAHPGGNITGLASLAGDEVLKQLQLLRETVPHAKRLAYLLTDTAIQTVSGSKPILQGPLLADSATKLGFEMRIHRVARPEEFDAAFATMLADRADALAVQFSALTFRERTRIADFSLRNRLPTVHGAAPFVDAGGLIYYGAQRDWMIKYSWTYVDRILRGARPADLPVELPRKFEMVVNMKTAKSLGLVIPMSVLMRADRVVE